MGSEQRLVVWEKTSIETNKIHYSKIRLLSWQIESFGLLADEIQMKTINIPVRLINQIENGKVIEVKIIVVDMYIAIQNENPTVW